MSESDPAAAPRNGPKPGPGPVMADPDEVRAHVRGLLDRIETVSVGGEGGVSGPAGEDAASLFEEAHRVLADALSTVDGI